MNAVDLAVIVNHVVAHYGPDVEVGVLDRGLRHVNKVALRQACSEAQMRRRWPTIYDAIDGHRDHVPAVLELSAFAAPGWWQPPGPWELQPTRWRHGAELFAALDALDPDIPVGDSKTGDTT